MDESHVSREMAGSSGAADLEALLAFYAARRLAPRYGAMPHIRAAVFEQAVGRSSLFGDLAAARRTRPARRLVAIGLAAALTMAAAASVVAAGPGSPLYEARIWLEGFTLPAAADDRAEAHRQHLEARLREAQAAAASGNASAVAQALAAYRAEVEAALADVGDDAEQLARLEAALGTHLVVLDTLAGNVPAQAADAIRDARNASNKAVQKIKDKKGPPSRPNQPRSDRS